MSFFTDKKEIQGSATALGYVAHVSIRTYWAFFVSQLNVLFYRMLFVIHFQNLLCTVSKLSYMFSFSITKRLFPAI